MKAKPPFLFAIVLLIVVLCSFSSNTRNSQHKISPVISISGDEPRNPNSKIFTGDLEAVLNQKQFTSYYSDSIYQITDVFMGVTSLYDYASNGVPQWLCQFHSYPASKDTLHAVFMWNMTPGIPAASRRCLYLISTNAGANWENLGQVPNNIASGFPAVELFNDGRPVVMNHAEVNGQGLHVVLFHDIFPGAGYFMLCDPGGGLIGQSTRVWPRFTTTATNKVPFLGAYNQIWDTVTWCNVLLNTSNCQFSGWQPMFDVDNAEQYAMARASNGTIGLAYIRVANVPPYTNEGDVAYVYSTNEGLTWSSPTIIFNAQPDPIDFMGALRGIDLVFVGNEPKVCFDLVHLASGGSYYPNLCSKVMSWSPNVNGGVPVVIADSTNTPCNMVQGVNDVHIPICRGSIGKSRDGQVLYCSYSVARTNVWPIDSTPYFDVYLAWSVNGGATWLGHKRLTNLNYPVSPVRDCRFSSLSPVNDVGGNFYYANLVYLNDSIPGTAVNGAPESPARFHFLRVKMSLITGTGKPSSEIPESFMLYQNYPNPFNPTTTINYGLPNKGFVTLKIFDILGREVITLVNEVQTAGNKSVEFNATDLPSGVYFYTIEVTDRSGSGKNFTGSKKMVLIK